MLKRHAISTKSVSVLTIPIICAESDKIQSDINDYAAKPVYQKG